MYNAPIMTFSNPGGIMPRPLCVAIFGVALLCSFFSAVAQDQNAVLTISPEHPKIGDVITVTYRPEVMDGRFKDAKEMEAQLLIYRADIYEPDNAPSRLGASMNRKDNAWTGSVKLSEPRAKYILIRVRSGDQRDDNDGKCWDALVYGDDNKPVRGAFLQRGSYYMGWGYFVFTSQKNVKDLSKAKLDLRQELLLYPDRWEADLRLWSIMNDENKDNTDKSALHKQLDGLYERWQSKQEAVFALYGNYRLIGDSVRAQSIRDAELKDDPKGTFAKKYFWSDISSDKNSSAQRVTLMEKYFGDFSILDENDYQAKLRNFVSVCIAAKEYDKAHEALTKMKKQDAQLYNNIAWNLIEKGENLEKATAWAKEAVEISQTPDQSTKNNYANEKEWLKGEHYSLGTILDTYAYGLMQLGKVDEAKERYAQAYEYTDGGEEDINTRYVECLIKTKSYSKAIEVGVECVKKGKAGEKMLDELKEAYAKSEGSDKGYNQLIAEKKKKLDEIIAEASKAKSEEMKKKVYDSRINKPSIDFTLKDFSGNALTLSSLKGKVVVVDFWATWCGPCKASFPYLQKVYEKYKDNQNIVFLAVDTWERIKGYDETVANAKKFMVDNKYTFLVVIDEITGTRVAEKYGVDGIPTKFVIDKKGNIAFETVGFSGPEMVEEMTQQIELLLGESIGSLK